MTHEELAEFMHEEYERIAPTFQYHTRKATRVPYRSLAPNVQGLMKEIARLVMNKLHNSGWRLPLDYNDQPDKTGTFLK